MKPVVGFLLFGCLLGKSWDLNAGTRRKFIERFLEIKVLTLHHKLEDIATLIALTEATPGAEAPKTTVKRVRKAAPAGTPPADGKGE